LRGASLSPTNQESIISVHGPITGAARGADLRGGGTAEANT
jgi:hypothetical protein